jgi:hypothetical protein
MANITNLNQRNTSSFVKHIEGSKPRQKFVLPRDNFDRIKEALWESLDQDEQEYCEDVTDTQFFEIYSTHPELEDRNINYEQALKHKTMILESLGYLSREREFYNYHKEINSNITFREFLDHKILWELDA